MLGLHQLVETSRSVAETSARSKKIALLADLLKQASAEEIGIAVAHLGGTLPQGRIGIAWAGIQEALGAAAHDTPAESTLPIREVDATFSRIAAVSGKGSTRERVALLAALLRRATADERDFVARLLMGELRQGALAGLMVEAIAQAADLPTPLVRRAAMTAGELGVVARVALIEGRAGLARFSIQLFRPVQPMLAQPTEGILEALGRLGEAALEFKFDGARVQIHKSGDEVRVFSRRLNDVTEAVPEVVTMARALPASELVLDGEVIALRPDRSPHPFQVTMSRFGRKLDIEEHRERRPLTPFLFDVLLLDGEPLIDEEHARRSRVLADLAPDQSLLVPSTITASVEDAEAFLQEALRRGHEGIMAKARGGVYEAGSRGQSWLKIKPSHTLDLVVLAAEWGHGRRSRRLSNLHLGARDPETGGFVMLGKTFKGLTDATLAWQTSRLLELQIGRESHIVHVRPELVVEIAFNDVQRSPHYPGGLALRFARVKRYRPDKTAAQADTIGSVREIFRRANPDLDDADGDAGS